MSVWGRITISTSAIADVGVVNVVSATMRAFGLASRRPMTRAQSIGCISAMFAPQVTTVSVSSKSS